MKPAPSLPATSELFRMDGMRVLLTGAGGAIGTVLAKAFADLGATVALLDDPGFRVTALAQSVDEPGAAPLVLGELTSAGRDGEGRVALRWRPAAASRHGAWLDRHSGGGGRAQVRLWTGSGMRRVPRGLLLGSASLEAPGAPGEAVVLSLEATGHPGAALRVRTGGARLARPARAQVRAAEVPR